MRIKIQLILFSLSSESDLDYKLCSAAPNNQKLILIFEHSIYRS